MTRHTKQGFPWPWGAALLVALATVARAQGPVAGAQSPAAIVRQALQANPVTAPYNLLTADGDGKVVIAGTVGTKQIHDIAIRLAIALGYPIRDELVIDTAAAHRVAAAQAQLQAQASTAGAARGALGMSAPSLGMAPGALPYTGSLPYVYPPPLFGRIDDPFFGFEPPLLSYPPWWGAVVARSRALATPIAPGQQGAANPNGGGAGAGAGALPSGPISIPLGPTPQDGVVEMTIDPHGVAILRGKVPSLADRVAIGQEIAKTPGVSEVLNLLEVATKMVPESPPLPPEPDANAQGAAGPAVQPDAAEGANPAIVVDGGPLTDRLKQAFAHRDALSGLPIRVKVRDGIATLEGRVPTVYEAMLAFRVVEQTPGVREVIDRLEFVVPDGEKQNPLIQQGRPEDVEPYLTAQIRRNVGDLAHIDRVRLTGDALEIWGSLDRPEDRPRLDAILRSIAVLRGFRLEPHIDIR